MHMLFIYMHFSMYFWANNNNSPSWNKAHNLPLAGQRHRDLTEMIVKGQLSQYSVILVEVVIYITKISKS